MYICSKCNSGLHEHRAKKCGSIWLDSTCKCNVSSMYPMIGQQVCGLTIDNQDRKGSGWCPYYKGHAGLHGWTRWGIKDKDMNYGSSLKLVFMDNWGKILYTEPFVMQKNYSSRLEDTLDSFRTGVQDALKDVERDIQDTDNLKQFTDYALKKALEKRGYKVTNKEDYPDF